MGIELVSVNNNKNTNNNVISSISIITSININNYTIHNHYYQ